jgi:hypothetical protein
MGEVLEDNGTDGAISSPMTECMDCNGAGYIEPEPYYLVERSDIRAALLGKELAPYIR